MKNLLKKLIPGLLFVYLVLFPFGQLTRLPVELFGFPEVRLYLTDLTVILLLFFWGIWRFFFLKKEYDLPPLAIPIFSFSLIGLFSLALATPLFSGREVLVASLYLFRWMAYAGLYFVVIDLKKELKWLKRQELIYFLIVIGAMVGIFGLVQYFLWPNLEALAGLGWDPHVYRLVSTFLDPGFTGLILGLTLILLVTLAWQKEKKRPLVMVGVIVYIALALTYSRSAYLAFLIGMGVITGLKRNPRVFLAILLIGVGTLLALPRQPGEGGKLERTYSIQTRIQNWRQSAAIARNHPFFGVGFNTYRYARENYGFFEEDEQEKWRVLHSGAGADSSLLFVLATTGIFGLFTYLWLWLRAALLRRSLVVIASLAVVFTHSFFLNSLFYPWVMAWLWLLLATENS